MPYPTRTKRFNTPNGPIDVEYTGNQEPTWNDVRNHVAQRAARSNQSGQSGRNAKSARVTPSSGGSGGYTPTLTLAQLSGQPSDSGLSLAPGMGSGGVNPTSLLAAAAQQSAIGAGSVLGGTPVQPWQARPTLATLLTQYKGPGKKQRPSRPAASAAITSSRPAGIPKGQSWNTAPADDPNVEEYDELPASGNPNDAKNHTLLRAASIGSKHHTSLLENIGQLTGVLPMEDYLGAAWESRVNHDRNAAKILLNQAFPDSTGSAFSASLRDNALPTWVGGAITRGVIGAEMPGPWWLKAGLALGLAVAGNTAMRKLQDGIKYAALGDEDMYDYGNNQQQAQADDHPYATIAGNVATSPLAGARLTLPQETESLASRFTRAFEPGKITNPARQWLNRSLDAAERAQAGKALLDQFKGRAINGAVGATQNSLQNLAQLEVQRAIDRLKAGHGDITVSDLPEIWQGLREDIPKAFDLREWLGNFAGNAILSNGNNLVDDAHAAEAAYTRKQEAVRSRPYNNAAAQEGMFGSDYGDAAVSRAPATGDNFADALQAKKPDYMAAAQSVANSARARGASVVTEAGQNTVNRSASPRLLKGPVQSGQTLLGRDGHVYQAISDESGGTVRVVRQGHSDRQTMPVDNLFRLLSGPSSSPARLSGGSTLSRSGAQRPWK